MSGVFVCIVGPSGAGKDTLIDGARRAFATDGRFHFPRRVVTRAVSDAEDHETVSVAGFGDLEDAGKLLLSWQAHGLSYGIPSSAKDHLEAGRTVVCNLSRRAVADARRQLAAVRVVMVTAPKDILMARLMGRGREQATDLEGRLDRDFLGDVLLPDLTINNVGDVDMNVTALVRFLRELADDSSISPFPLEYLLR